MDLMGDCDSELAGDVSAYLRTHGYLSELSKFQDVNVAEYFISEIIDATHSICEASAPHVILDIRAAVHQFNLFKNWILSLQDHTRSEFDQILAPLLSHMYLECLPRHKPDDCLDFIRKFSDCLLSNSDWSIFWEELSRCSSLSDLSQFPLIRAFRECKIDVSLSTRSLQLLRKYLRRNDCRTLTQVLTSWFKFVILADNIQLDENDDDEFISDINEIKAEIELDKRKLKSDSESDPTLRRLLNVVKNKRATPALLLYTAYQTSGIVCGRLSNDQTLIATGDQRSEVRVWQAEKKKSPLVPGSDELCQTPSVSSRSTIDDLETGRGKIVKSLRGHSSTVYDVSFIPSTDYLVSVSFDTTMRLWQLSDLTCSAVYRGHDAPVWAVAPSPILNLIATASHDKTARLWSLDRTFPLRIFAGHMDDVTCVAFHSNGHFLATGSSDRSVRFWSATNGNLTRVLGGGSENFGPVEALAFSPCGQFLASSGDDQFVWLWNVKAGRAFCQLEGHSSRIVSLDWSLDGNSVAACTFDGDIFVWQLEKIQNSDDELVPIKYPTNCSTMLSIRYSENNSLMAVGLSSDR